jgi:sortase A
MIFLPQQEAEELGAEETSEPDLQQTGRGAGIRIGPGPSVHRGSGVRTASRSLLLAGVVLVVFVLYELTLTGLAYQRSQVALLDQFKQLISATNLDDPATSLPEGSSVAILTIPGIGVNDVVVEGSTAADLKLGPGHLRNTPLPGEFGNAVLAGRRTTYGAPFAGLDRLGKGDVIVVTTGQGRFEYVVASVGRVGAGVATPLTGTLDSRLTLITADPQYMPTGRLVVVAMLRGSPAAIATRPEVPITAQETGLSGNWLGLLLALIWGQLLAGAIWLTMRLRRRLTASVTLMFATPVLLALGLLLFGSLDLAMPAAL